MSHYQNILVGISLDPEADQPVLAKLKELQEGNPTVTLVHSVEYTSNYGVAYGVSVGVDVENELKEGAKEAMKALGAAAGVEEQHLVVEAGPSSFVLLREAKERNVDLILIGSHGRHGVRLLLGSTANAVLHGAECDVLAVRVKD